MDTKPNTAPCEHDLVETPHRGILVCVKCVDTTPPTPLAYPTVDGCSHNGPCTDWCEPITHEAIKADLLAEGAAAERARIRQTVEAERAIRAGEAPPKQDHLRWYEQGIHDMADAVLAVIEGGPNDA